MTARIRPSLLQQSINISCPPGPQQQTCRTLLHQTNGTNGLTEGRTSYRFIDPAPHTMRTGRVNQNKDARTHASYSAQYLTKLTRLNSRLNVMKLQASTTANSEVGLWGKYNAEPDPDAVRNRFRPVHRRIGLSAAIGVQHLANHWRPLTWLVAKSALWTGIFIPRRFSSCSFLHKIALLLTPTAYNSTSGPRVTKNTNRKSYFASQTKPSACYCEDRTCVKSPEFYAQYADAALKLRPYGAIQIWLLLLLLLSACYPWEIDRQCG